MHNWKKGDLGILLDIDVLQANGRIVEVLSTPYQEFSDDTWHVKIVPFTQGLYNFDAVNVLYIRPVPGFDAGSWDEVEDICGWRPKELERVEV